MSRKRLIAANWKMYKTPAEARACSEALLPLCLDHTRDEIVICPPAISLSVVLDILSGSGIAVGAQNMHFAEEGAFTGEISAQMLTSMPSCARAVRGCAARCLGAGQGSGDANYARLDRHASRVLVRRGREIGREGGGGHADLFLNGPAVVAPTRWAVMAAPAATPAGQLLGGGEVHACWTEHR